MDLKTFVAESITQIAEGIKAAQSQGCGAAISPRIISSERSPELAGVHMQSPQLVSFDVAITVSEVDKFGGGGKLKVAFVSFGAGTESHMQHEVVSRVRFDIAVCWPNCADPQK